MSKKVINELSLVPNLLKGLTGTTSTTGQTNVPAGQTSGSQSQLIAKNAQSLTKQINDLTKKIVTAKQQAAKSNQPQQQQLTQTILSLQQQLGALSKAENEETTRAVKHVASGLYKKIGELGGGAIGAATKVPGAAAAGSALGKYTAGKMSKFLGLEDEESTIKNNKKNDHSTLNNIKHTNMATKKKNTNVKESIAGTIGDVAKGVIDTAGDIGGAIPIVGGALKGAANIASRATGAVLGSNEQEESSNSVTPIQDNVVTSLSKKKYHVTKVSHQFAEEEGGPTVFLTKRPNRYTSLYAEVSPEGLVNGMSLEEFLGNEENEEKMLSRKQKEIAQAAPPYDKITGADFKALKKENFDTINFLKSISQKKYAEADKYLGSIVNEKLKTLIAKAARK